jgi:hypothetical protein
VLTGEIKRDEPTSGVKGRGHVLVVDGKQEIQVAAIDCLKSLACAASDQIAADPRPQREAGDPPPLRS